MGNIAFLVAISLKFDNHIKDRSLFGVIPVGTAYAKFGLVLVHHHRIQVWLSSPEAERLIACRLDWIIVEPLFVRQLVILLLILVRTGDLVRSVLRLGSQVIVKLQTWLSIMSSFEVNKSQDCFAQFVFTFLHVNYLRKRRGRIAKI